MNQSEVFIEMIVAAMLDAAVEMKLTQLKTTITPVGTNKAKYVRIIVVPESMEREWPEGLGVKQ